MEHIVFNSLILTKPDGLVYTLKKENLYESEDFDKLYTEGDGYDFFFALMNALGTDYFKKVKHKSDVDWKKVIKFIVIAIIVAYVAKGLLKSPSSLSNSDIAAKVACRTNMLEFNHAKNVICKSWFIKGLAKGGFF